MGFKRPEETNRILTIIGAETQIVGVLQGNGPVRIDGNVDGEIIIDGDIIIGESAVIKAQVKGRNISVAGKMIGDVEATNKLEIMASGSVEGDVRVFTLQVADGGILTGNCSMRREGT